MWRWCGMQERNTRHKILMFGKQLDDNICVYIGLQLFANRK